MAWLDNYEMIQFARQYRVDTKRGRIVNRATGREVCLSKETNGRHLMKWNGKQLWRDQLIWAFGTPAPKGSDGQRWPRHRVTHINLVRHDDRLENLALDLTKPLHQPDRELVDG